MLKPLRITSALKTARESFQAGSQPQLKQAIFQGLREANSARDTDAGLEFMELAYEAGIVADLRQVDRLRTLIPKEHPQRVKLAKLIRAEKYLSPPPAFLSFIFKNYHTSLRGSPIYNKILADTESGVNKDIAPINILIEGLAKQGDVKGVESAIEVMKKADIEPNNKSFGSLMEAYSRGQHSDKVISVWHSNPNKTPDNCLNQISILFDSCGFNSSLEVLKREWAIIKRNTYILNENVYASYIQALIRQKDTKEAASIFLNEYCKQFEVILTDKAPKMMIKVFERFDEDSLGSETKTKLMTALSLPL